MVDYLSTTITIAEYWYTNELKAVVELRGFKPNLSVNKRQNLLKKKGLLAKLTWLTLQPVAGTN
ncbi:hypothetical protein [Nodularia chucula]|uniref:hypothetical protein n=1 Tax=Nodularia chucula TaxID=3093667 RepID=UPI0039C75C3C